MLKSRKCYQLNHFTQNLNFKTLSGVDSNKKAKLYREFLKHFFKVTSFGVHY